MSAESGNFRAGSSSPGRPRKAVSRGKVGEELGIAVEVGPLLDCWVYEAFPKREVVMVTYGLRRRDKGDLRVSEEHRRIGLFGSDQIDRISLPCGYHRAVRAWRHLLRSEERGS
jgi:hypothetical protein